MAERGAEFSRLGLSPLTGANPARARTAAGQRRGCRRRSAAACGTKHRCRRPSGRGGRGGRRAGSRSRTGASRQGVVRAMARSDHWRWVSTPRWSRTSRKVTSTCQRWTNQRTICSGSRAGSVQSRACGSKRRWGSRSSTQRIGTTGRPAWRQTAVAEQISTTRSPSPYQPGTVTRCQRVVSSTSTSARVGRRAPLVRGRPTVPGRRGGAGSYSAASSRRRVMQVRPCRASVSQELQGGEAAVAQQHDLAPGQPAACLQGHLPRPVGQLLVPPAALAAVALRGGERGQERQRPDAPGPGDRGQQHQAEPAQAAGLDEVALRGADRVAVDALGADALAAAALDRVVDAQHAPGRSARRRRSAGRAAGGPPPGRLQAARLSTRW